ncbi:hypothetical protein niasHT_000428 [Heterodera trifolii]|uniref:BTB domain-containing protein n=1 Tax=Heterodera trifolii TaxID=157864 RepID=A0ABD2M2W8_9BILA
MSQSMVDRMKHLLSTGEDADVYFLVGDGDGKELLSAHKLVLKHASEVFAAMFRFDAKNEKKEFASANCPVEVSDVEAAAFKVMLSFIYTDDLSELNGDNAMAVLYAAKKYNIPGLVLPSLQIPIPKLSNAFLAYAQALLFEFEDFARECLRYICQNAVKLFRLDHFLQIYQKMLCSLLDNDRLLFSDDFAIWKAALRWADEKCRQNAIECSSENRRSVLGPAVFKIHFPNVHEDDFAKGVVPSGLLTVEEVLGVYQFNSHPYLYLRGVPGLYPSKFPSNGRISDWNTTKGNRRGTLALEIEKIHEFAGEEPWHSVFSATFRIVSEKSEADNSIGTRCDYVIIDRSRSAHGFENFITFAELMEPSNGFYNRKEDKLTLVIDLIAKEEKLDKFILEQSKSKGTLFMEIEKVSGFAREIIFSERKSETVLIKGVPWKIWAKIKTKNGSTDNEKWLGIYLLCVWPKEDSKWRCKCLATFRIVSQNSVVARDMKEMSKERIVNNKSTYWGFSNFISFAALMDPSKGLYDTNKDKVTLAIDVTVKEAKTEDKS